MPVPNSSQGGQIPVFFERYQSIVPKSKDNLIRLDFHRSHTQFIHEKIEHIYLD